MKRLVICLLAVSMFAACNSDEKKTTSENDVDAARNFLDAALDGKWNQAKGYLLQDSMNVQLLETVEDKYNKLSSGEKVNYKDAHPILHDKRQISDSVSVVKYSNSYTNRKDSLKIVHTNGQWLVDLNIHSSAPTRQEMFNSILLVGLGGGVGSVLRYLIQRSFNASVPWGTFAVNISGCLLIGMFWGWFARQPGDDKSLLLMTGLCGGFTTFSAFTYEGVVMMMDQRWLTFIAYTGGSVVIGMVATFLGFKMTGS